MQNATGGLILDLDSSVSETDEFQEGSAYNLGNLLRRLVLPPRVKHWTLTTIREKLIKIGAKGVRHVKYLRFQLAEVAVPRKLFAAILERIQRLRTVPCMVLS